MVYAGAKIGNLRETGKSAEGVRGVRKAGTEFCGE